MKKLLITTAILSALSINAVAAPTTSLADSVAADQQRLSQIFEHIHANPEVGFAEHNTAAIVAKELNEAGFEVHEGIAGTGVVGILKNGKGPTVMFRADMDALPIKEQTNLPYAATEKTIDADGHENYAMHACGHDAHATWLIGMAKQLSERTNEWKGTVILVAQPAEELIMGATAMVNDDLYKIVPKPDVLIAGHTHPIFPEDTVGIREGIRMAGTDQIDVHFNGVGGHGSTPHATKDPVVMAAMATMGYQTITSRMLDQSQPAVLTVGSIQTGSENNIIPDDATVKINLRWNRDQDRQVMIDGIKQVSDNVAQMYGVEQDKMPTYEMKGYSIPVVNAKVETKLVRQAMIDALGEDKVLTGMPATMGSEDFHMLTSPYPDVPVVFVEVGAAKQSTWDNFIEHGKMPKHINHNPNYVIEQGTLATGTVALTSAVMNFLQ
ncbi:amidohydrolase [Vibrio genomosp. F10]|uniref:amidohydrolase n=2 Tax=Vibrio genomosp. F10 TaxID=723171 RepID=UPI00030550C6|nr:amidohydrolase [Vibrio genomosp. F10]OEF09425.1 amidohydrolase [Vibrio genomosp. F10 str. 9ZB36]